MLTLCVGRDRKLYWKKQEAVVHTDEFEKTHVRREKEAGEAGKRAEQVDNRERGFRVRFARVSMDEVEQGHSDSDGDWESVDEEQQVAPIGEVKQIRPVARMKRETPVIKYPRVKVKNKNFLEQFGLNEKQEGRQILVPSKKKVHLKQLVPLHLMASAKSFKALQESEEWKKMRAAMVARSEGSEEHFDVTDLYEVRCGAYNVCTKCLNIRTKPPRISSIYKTPKDKNASGGGYSLYDTWANSLKELNPYLEMRDKASKRKQKELAKQQEPPEKPESPKNQDLNFDDVYSFLNEAMNKIESSSEKTKRRLTSSKGSSQKFLKHKEGGSNNLSDINETSAAESVDRTDEDPSISTG